MRNNRSRRSTLSAAILWTLVAFVWGVVTVTRYNDPTTVGDSLVLTIFTMLLALALAVIFWIRFARFSKKE